MLFDYPSVISILNAVVFLGLGVILLFIVMVFAYFCRLCWDFYLWNSGTSRKSNSPWKSVRMLPTLRDGVYKFQDSQCNKLVISQSNYLFLLRNGLKKANNINKNL